MRACMVKMRAFVRPVCRSSPTGCGRARVFQLLIPELPHFEYGGQQAKPRSRRRAFLDVRRGWQDIAVYDYRDLSRDDQLVGPAVVETPTTTVALPQGCSATLDRLGNMVIHYADVV